MFRNPNFLISNFLICLYIPRFSSSDEQAMLSPTSDLLNLSQARCSQLLRGTVRCFVERGWLDACFDDRGEVSLSCCPLLRVFLFFFRIRRLLFFFRRVSRTNLDPLLGSVGSYASQLPVRVASPRVRAPILVEGQAVLLSAGVCGHQNFRIIR